MQALINQHELILMEAAIVEPIRRDDIVPLDPQLIHAGLIYDTTGRNELERLYLQYGKIAIDADLPFLMCTPTWRANSERVRLAGANPNINRDAAEFLCEIREDLKGSSIKVGGLIGCKNDCYQPMEALSVDEAEEFHDWQIRELADSEIDFLFAATLPSIDEATGIARAMAKTDTPYFISFVIDRLGTLLDGTSLTNAIRTIDTESQRKPIGFLINCAYPTFLCADEQPPELFSRLIGFQANASSLDHSELDCVENLQMNEVAQWGEEMLALHFNHGIKILGGCCGTNSEHLRYIIQIANSKSTKNMDINI